jgi:hypothetical protein
MNAWLRAKTILGEPVMAWPQIENDGGDAADALVLHAAIWALVPALAGYFAAAAIGVIRPDGSVARVTALDGLFGAIFRYVASCAGVFVVGILINLTAPAFGGRRNFDSAIKLAAYSYTPVWLCGVFLMLPGLRFLGLIGCYGTYLLWCGLPQLMKMPRQRGWAATLLIAACAAALYFASDAAQYRLFGTPRS